MTNNHILFTGCESWCHIVTSASGNF